MLVTSGRVYDLAAYLHRGECELCHVEANLVPPIARAIQERDAFLEHRNATPRIFPVREFRPRSFRCMLKGQHRGKAIGQTFVIRSRDLQAHDLALIIRFDVMYRYISV